MTGRRILVISPAFHGYWRSIERAFEADGHVVATHLYDHFATFAAKTRNKVLYELPDRTGGDRGATRFGRDATAAAIAAVRRFKPDVILAVKADVFTDALWEETDCRDTPVVLWLYDELRRTHHRTGHLDPFRAVASYSRHDVTTLDNLGITTRHVPLAFDPAFTKPAVPSDDLVFVGARYPGREHLLTAAHERGIPVRAYGRDWSHRPLDRARTWSWKRPDVPWGPELTHAQSCAHMAGALAALNIHGDQDGFTMRTFEAAGVGALQLVDRADVTEFYDDSTEVLSFADLDELVDHVCRAKVEPAWAEAIRAAGKARTLAEHTFQHRTRALAELWD